MWNGGELHESELRENWTTFAKEGIFRRIAPFVFDNLESHPMHPVIQEKRADIAALCHRYHVRKLEVFGSAARGVDFDPASSDADFLVVFGPDADPGLKDFLDLKGALEDLLGCEVDLIERISIENSRNYIRRRHILGQAESVYMA